VTYSNAAGDLWLGDFFGPDDASKINLRTATTFRYQNSDGTVVTVTGTGFTYVNGVPTGGTISSIVVADGATTLVTISGLNTQLYDFYYAAFGWDRDDRPRQNGDGWQTLSVLLAGNDTINGGNGNDDIIAGGNEGNDVIKGNGGDDFINGSRGNDTMNGGTGFDTLSYEDSHFGNGAFRGIVLDVGLGTVTDCWNNKDKISNFEQFRGSRFNDSIKGTVADQEFLGFRGADTIDAGGTSQQDWDQVRYDRDARYGGNFGIDADMSTGKIRDGFGSFDTVTNVELIVGTKFADTFKGGGTNSHGFVGQAGVDSYDGAGADDGIEFWGNNTAGAVLDMTKATGQIVNDGFGNTETYTGVIEWFWGTGLADNFKGNAAANWLGGGRGNDTISGGGGNDNIRGAEDADRMTGGAGADRFVWQRENEGFANDVITDFQTGVDDIVFRFNNFTGMDGTVRFSNSAAATQAGSSFFFNAADQKLYWDSDGTGAGAAIAVVKLTGLTAMAAGDIVLEV
jgi:Ca2+-binding RTX toxin-like protein